MYINIILFTNRGGRVLSFKFNPLRIGLLVGTGMALLCVLGLYGGLQLGQDGLKQWQQVVQEQQLQIDDARKSARTHLDALTLRIGRMQAQMLQLNALGNQLVAQASLDKDEFDFNNLPAVGGPEDVAGLESIELPDFLSMLDELSVEMEDRGQKLSVLDTLLMDRSLHDRVMPSGSPVKNGWVSSGYGKRTDPFTGKKEFHKGVDLAGKEGSRVLSVGDGIVTWVGKRTGYGNLVEITHGNGYVTRYGHNKKLLVTVGDSVKKGQQIAVLGSTGRSTGPHVHFEVVHNGQQVNPSKYLTD
ncbi:MAG: M23 family metallopeptidase [Gammaproteobacteria bacterium]